MPSIFESIGSLGSLGSLFGSSVNPDKSLKEKSEKMLNKLFSNQNPEWAIREEAPSQQSISQNSYRRPASITRSQLPPSSTSQTNSSGFVSQSIGQAKSVIASTSIAKSIVSSIGKGSAPSTALLTPGTQASVKLLNSTGCFGESLSKITDAMAITPKANSGFFELIKKQAGNIFGTTYRVLGNMSPKYIAQTVKDPKALALLGLAIPFIVLLMPSHQRFYREVHIPIVAKERKVYTFDFMGKDHIQNTVQLTVESGKVIPPFTQLHAFNNDTSKSSFGLKSVGLFNFVTYKANEYHSLYTIHIYDPNLNAKQNSESWIQIAKDSFIRVIQSNNKSQAGSISKVNSSKYKEIDLVTILGDTSKTIDLQPFNGEQSNEFVRVHVE